MNFRQVVQFLTVADTLSFRKAAERLHIAQPPLSTSIKRLEADLNVQLFERSKRGVRLTEAGMAILDDARKIAFHSDQLRKAADALRAGVGGRLRIGFVGSATYALLPRVLPRFRARYPNVLLELSEGTTAEILRDVEGGALDLGLVRYPFAQVTSLDVVPIDWDRLVAAMPPTHRLARRRRLALSDLAGEPFIIYSATAASSLHAQVVQACQLEGFSPRITQEAVQVQTLISLVESGIGVALVPAVSSASAGKRVLFRELAASASLSVAIGVVAPQGIASGAASRFRDLLLEGQPVQQRRMLNSSSRVGPARGRD